MALLTILRYPDKRLRHIAQMVETVDNTHLQLVENMFETMYSAPGVGLAATQVNVHQQIIVIDISEEKNQPLCLINPQIIEKTGCENHDEGCLSVPEIYASIERAEKVTVKALNQHGEPFTLEADGLLAICIQHEMDHLMGKLFVDYLSPLKQQRIKIRLKKMLLETQRQTSK